MTRRFFGGLLAAVGAVKRAHADVSGFVMHRVLRRPYGWTSPPLYKEGRVFRAVELCVQAEKRCQGRLWMGSAKGEPIMELAVPLYGDPNTLRATDSVNNLRAEQPVYIRLESPVKFRVLSLRAKMDYSGEEVRRIQDQRGESGSLHSCPDLGGVEFYREGV